MKKLKYIGFSTILAGLLVGCGSSSSNTASSSATLIDDFVGVKVKYSNGSPDTTTDTNGNFPYTDGTVEFFVGDVKLGTVNAVPVDGKVFLQDIVGVPRTDTTNTDVIKLGRFLQSLDSDPSTDAIEIDNTNYNLFVDPNGTETDLQDSATNVDTLLNGAGFTGKAVVTADDAKRHIENILEAHGHRTPSVSLSLSTQSMNDGDTNIDIDEDSEFTFSDDIPRQYLTSNYFTLTNDSTNATVAVSFDTEIDNAGNVIVVITPDSDLNYDENYTLTIKYTIKNYAGTAIDLGGTTDKIITFATETAANLAPIANAGVDQTVTSGTSVTLDASASSDSDGTIASYSWAEGSTVLSTSSSFSKSDFSVGTHNITLTVTDDDGATSTDDVIVTVNAAANVIPVANAGADQTVTQGSTVTLDGSASSDSDGSIVSYQWMEGSTLLSNNASFTKSDFSVGTHTLSLTVTDNNNGVHTDTVTITVNAASGGNTGGNTSSNEFILKINTEAYGNNGTNDFLVGASTSNASLNVDCDNDGTNEVTNVVGGYTCSYANDGVYDVRVSGTYGGLTFRYGDPKKITEIVNWGDNQWTEMAYMFFGASNLTTIASNAGVPDLSNVTSLAHMFNGAGGFNTDISSWDTSNITDMNNMFNNAGAFNQDISTWNTSNVTDMSIMFRNTGFNQDISSWDTSSVTNMYAMFFQNSRFNQNLDSWDVSNVTNMREMFYRASAFNQDISSWQIQNVTNMSSMFNGARAFNQDLSVLYPRKNANLVTRDMFVSSGMTQANQDSFLTGPVSSTPLNAVITAQGQSGTPFCSPSQRVGSEFITLTGSSSTGNIVSYSWTDVTAGNSNNFIDGGTTVSETYSCVGLPGGTRTIRLTITDSSGATDTQDQTLNVVY